MIFRPKNTFPRWLPGLLMLALCPPLWATGCGGDDDATLDAGPGRDATVDLMCSGEMPLEVGRCERSDGSECNGCEAGGMFEGAVGCTGDPGGPGIFVPIASGDEVSAVLGPQGSVMIIFGLRATGIDPGAMAAEWPRVEVRVVDRASGVQQAQWTNLHQEFTPDATVGGAFTAPLLFIVTMEQTPSQLIGHSLAVIGRARDKNGAGFCGATTARVARYIDM